MSQLTIKPQLLTTAQAAKYLGIKSGTLNNWRSRDEGPTPTRMGRLVKYSVREFDKYISQNTKRT